MDRHTKVWDQDPPVEGLAKASQAPPADETGAVYAALSGELAACRLSAFRPESCQKPAAQNRPDHATASKVQVLQQG